jgi:hypothetical protein
VLVAMGSVAWRNNRLTSRAGIASFSLFRLLNPVFENRGIPASENSCS